MSTGNDYINSSGIIFLVPFLATKEALAPLANNPIMLGRSIWSFGHLECQNPSIIDVMGHCSRIRKNVTDREQTDREINYRGHSNCCTDGTLGGVGQYLISTD